MRGEHRIEDASARFFRNSRPAIFNGYEYIVGDQFCSQSNSSPRWSLAQRVQHEIQQHSVHQLRICGEAKLRFTINFDFNLFSRCQGIDERLYSPKQRRHTNRFRNWMNRLSELKDITDCVIQQ